MLAQLRSAVVDLLVGCGLSSDRARAALPAAQREPSGSSTSTTTGAWSEAPLPLRASRSTYASVTATDGVAST